MGRAIKKGGALRTPPFLVPHTQAGGAYWRPRLRACYKLSLLDCDLDDDLNHVLRLTLVSDTWLVAFLWWHDGELTWL